MAVRRTELAGPSGSGKSTLLKAIGDDLMSAGVTVFGLAESAPRPPDDWDTAYLRLAEDAISKCADPAAVRRLLRRMFWRLSEGGEGLHPEATVHHLWRLRWLSGTSVSRVLRHAPICDLVIVLDIPSEVSRERVRAKNGALGPINRQLAEADSAVIRRAASTYERVLRQASRRTSVIRVPTTGDQDAAAERLLEAILRHMPP